MVHFTAPRAASARGAAGEVNESLLIARGGHGQFHERVDVECEVAGGRYTTSKRELAAQYADIYFFRLHKVRSPREASHKDEEPRLRIRGAARGSSCSLSRQPVWGYPLTGVACRLPPDVARVCSSRSRSRRRRCASSGAACPTLIEFWRPKVGCNALSLARSTRI
jgi:hypothetical protein